MKWRSEGQSYLRQKSSSGQVRSSVALTKQLKKAVSKAVSCLAQLKSQVGSGQVACDRGGGSSTCRVRPTDLRAWNKMSQLGWKRLARCCQFRNRPAVNRVSQSGRASSFQAPLALALSVPTRLPIITPSLGIGLPADVLHLVPRAPFVVNPRF